MNQKGKILYSSDGSGVNLIDKKTPKVYESITPSKTSLKLRIEKKGRGGKTVSVIFNLPENPEYFKTLVKELKKVCGTGGSLKENQIEIQGENLDKIRSFLIKKGFMVTGQ